MASDIGSPFSTYHEVSFLNKIRKVLKKKTLSKLHRGTFIMTKIIGMVVRSPQIQQNQENVKPIINDWETMLYITVFDGL